MSAHTYDESKGIAWKTIVILGVITVIEVLIALVGKGYVIGGFVPYDWSIGGFPFGRGIMYLLMISMSVYKAYLVIFEFMHMKYEVKGLMRSVLLPTALLIWAIIAFFMEGSYWRTSRAEIDQKNMEQSENTLRPLGEVIQLEDTGH